MCSLLRNAEVWIVSVNSLAVVIWGLGTLMQLLGAWPAVPSLSPLFSRQPVTGEC